MKELGLDDETILFAEEHLHPENISQKQFWFKNSDVELTIMIIIMLIFCTIIFCALDILLMRYYYNNELENQLIDLDDKIRKKVEKVKDYSDTPPFVICRTDETASKWKNMEDTQPAYPRTVPVSLKNLAAVAHILANTQTITNDLLIPPNRKINLDAAQSAPSLPQFYQIPDGESLPKVRQELFVHNQSHLYGDSIGVDVREALLERLALNKRAKEGNSVSKKEQRTEVDNRL